MRADSTFKVHIVGYCDKWGGDEFNERFSYMRASHIAEWMFSCRVPRQQVTIAGKGIDRGADSDASARRVEFSRVVIIEPEPMPEPEPTPEPEPEPIPMPEPEIEPAPIPTPEIEPTPEPVVPVASPPAQMDKPKIDLSLRTNLIYLLGGVMNIGAEWRPNETQFGVLLNGGYSPFGDTDWSHNMGGWFLSPEFRYYLPNREGWFVGAQLLAAGYNFKLSDTGRQGSLIGVGAMGGYKITLSDTFDMDFTLGVGYAHFSYDTYFRCEPNEINPYIEKNLKKSTIFPLQVGVNLIWKTTKR